MEEFNDVMLHAINYRLFLKGIPIKIDYVDKEEIRDQCEIKFACEDYERWLDRPILNPTDELIQVIRDLFKEMYYKELLFNNTRTIFWIRNSKGE